jgi:hypothetical protein
VCVCVCVHLCIQLCCLCRNSAVAESRSDRRNEGNSVSRSRWIHEGSTCLLQFFVAVDRLQNSLHGVRVSQMTPSKTNTERPSCGSSWLKAEPLNKKKKNAWRIFRKRSISRKRCRSLKPKRKPRCQFLFSPSFFLSPREKGITNMVIAAARKQKGEERAALKRAPYPLLLFSMLFCFCFFAQRTW